MRSAIIAAAFAVGALAVPFQQVEQRDLVIETDYDIKYVTQVVTVTATAGGAAPSPTPQMKHGYGGHGHHHFGTSPAAPSPPAPSANNPQPQPAPEPSPTTPQTDLLPTSTASPSPSSGGGSAGGSGSDGGKDSSAPSGSAGSSYSDIAVYHHNIHRRNHSASDIAWDTSLESSAAQIAASCVYAHNVDVQGGGYGQNIAAGVEPNNISAIITNLFYNGEISNYDGLYGEANPSMALFEEWGHFTQIVWKATTHVGCATQDCSGQGLANVGGDVAPYFTVCNYKSPGNFGGEYGENVGEPLGEPTANWNTGLS